MSTLKVDGIRSNSATSDAITLASDGTCTANITNKPNRNLIINGAMQVAQRGTSDSSTNGNGTVDRFQLIRSGVDENPTQAQVDVASGTTPYTLGFRKAFKVTNGNQTGGAGVGDYITMRYKIEAQDIANSGWNYTSSSSLVTLSFWCKSSVAQNFYGYLKTVDGTAQLYSFETGSLSADTWTKVELNIAGDSNLQFDNDNDIGFEIYISQFWGTDRTASKSLNSWAAYNGGARTPDFTSTWYTTNDATWELTGVQLEVGSVATDFEHRSFSQELALCQRYFQFIGSGFITSARGASSSMYLYSYTCPVNLRASPTVSTNNDLAHGTFNVRRYRDGTGISDSTNTPTANTSYFVTTNNTVHLQQDGFTATDDRSATIFLGGGAITLDSEL